MPNTPPPNQSLDQSRELLSVPAILSYVWSGVAAMFGILLFCLIYFKVALDPLMAGLLGGFLAFIYAQVTNTVGYFTTSSSGGKIANAALAQLAGAGAPPPATPLSPPDPTKDSPNDNPDPAVSTR